MALDRRSRRRPGFLGQPVERPRLARATGQPGFRRLIELFLSAFITLFVVIDPPGCGPIYAGLTKGAAPAHRRSMAVRAVLISAGILLAFALFGKQLLHV